MTTDKASPGRFVKRRSLIASSATVALGLVSPVPLRAAAAETGVLVGSLGAKWRRAALWLGVEFSLRSESGNFGALKWSNQGGLFGNGGGIDMPAADMPAVEGLKLVVVHERLPAGQYEMRKLLTRPWQFAGENKEELHQIRIPFEIQPGRATYMGELVAWMTSGAELPFGWAARTGLALTLRDESERDLRVLRAKGVAFADEPPLRVSWLDAEVPPQIKRVP